MEYDKLQQELVELQGKIALRDVRIALMQKELDSIKETLEAYQSYNVIKTIYTPQFIESALPAPAKFFEQKIEEIAEIELQTLVLKFMKDSTEFFHYGAMVRFSDRELEDFLRCQFEKNEKLREVYIETLLPARRAQIIDEICKVFILMFNGYRLHTQASNN